MHRFTFKKLILANGCHTRYHFNLCISVKTIKNYKKYLLNIKLHTCRKYRNMYVRTYVNFMHFLWWCWWAIVYSIHIIKQENNFSVMNGGEKKILIQLLIRVIPKIPYSTPHSNLIYSHINSWKICITN